MSEDKLCWPICPLENWHIYLSRYSVLRNLCPTWISLHKFFVVQADTNDDAIYTYNNYYYNQYDLEQLIMSDDCKKVDELLQLIALKSHENFYVLNSIVGGIMGFTGFDPRVRSQREELACDIASKLK